jgi:hypothetical protein
MLQFVARERPPHQGALQRCGGGHDLGAMRPGPPRHCPGRGGHLRPHRQDAIRGGPVRGSPEGARLAAGRLRLPPRQPRPDRRPGQEPDAEPDEGSEREGARCRRNHHDITVGLAASGRRKRRARRRKEVVKRTANGPYGSAIQR